MVVMKRAADSLWTDEDGIMSEETKDADGRLDLLRAPFEPHQISKLPKPTIKNEEWKKLPRARCVECGGYHATTNTVHLDYVGHAALTDRLLDADPQWTWTPMALDDKGLPLFDESGGLWITLEVCGVIRLGYGNAEDKTYMDAGARVKEVIGDALRNAAMRFGAALDLWHKGELHKEDDWESQVKKLRITKAVQQQIVSQSLACLERDDATGLQEIWDEHGSDHKVVLWQLFNSQQRVAMKRLLKPSDEQNNPA